MNSDSRDAPRQPSGKATIPDAGSFADLILQIEAHIHRARVPVGMIGNDHLSDLIACIREQQAALGAMLTQFGMDEDEWNAPTFKQARAVLAKWRIE